MIAVLGGELAAPYTRNPLYRDRIPLSINFMEGCGFTRDVDSEVLRNETLRTVSGQEWSSTKQRVSCAVGSLRRSYLYRFRFGRVEQRRLHSFLFLR